MEISNRGIEKRTVGAKETGNNQDKLADLLKKIDKNLQTNEDFIKVVRQGQERNFYIKINEAGTVIKLKHKEKNEERNLDIFLPPGYFFKKGEILDCNYKTKEIHFPEREIQFRGFVLSLFHEIGHAHEKQKLLSNITIPLYNMKFSLQVAFELMRSISIKREVQQTGKSKKIIFKVKVAPLLLKMPQLSWYFEKLRCLRMESERSAWAFALKSLRKLEQEGYGVLSEFDSVAQIEGYVACCLYTHEVDSFYEKIGFFTKTL